MVDDKKFYKYVTQRVYDRQYEKLLDKYSRLKNDLNSLKREMKVIHELLNISS